MRDQKTAAWGIDGRVQHCIELIRSVGGPAAISLHGSKLGRAQPKLSAANLRFGNPQFRLRDHVIDLGKLPCGMANATNFQRAFFAFNIRAEEYGALLGVTPAEVRPHCHVS